jgi:hypothetical protein
VVKALIIGVVVVLGASGAASAQTAQQNTESEQFRRARAQISRMEGVLERAVQNGVNNLRRKVRAVMPDDALLQGGLPQVRGFRLEGYGVFFDVEVPGLRPSMAWTLRTMNETGAALARDLAQMRAYVQSLPDPRVRTELDRTLQRIQRGIGPVPAEAPERASAQGIGPGTVAAQSVDPGVAGAPPSVTPQVDQALLIDPSEAYTEEVKAALIDAMIEYSGALVIGADEWLTVAAKDNEPSNPFTQGDPDVMTILLRIKGSDIAAFQARRVTLEEVRTRVEVREF